jgi:hypothetical protein
MFMEIKYFFAQMKVEFRVLALWRGGQVLFFKLQLPTTTASTNIFLFSEKMSDIRT